MPKKRSPFRNAAEEGLVRALLGVFARLSPEAAEAAGRGLGRLLGRALTGRRRLAERNLSRAFPGLDEARVRALAGDVFAHFGGLAAELLRSAALPVEETLERIEVVGFENVRAASASGRGFFMLTPHLGNWEFAAIATGAKGPSSSVIARPLDNPLLDRLLTDFRQRTGNRVVPKSEAAREMLRTLRSGGSIGILPDQHAHPPDAVVVPFFGLPASTTTAVARFAERTGALVVPAACVRIAPARWRLTFYEPLDVRSLPPEERTIEAFTARVNLLVEGLVRERPDQWLWLHNRWRLD